MSKLICVAPDMLQGGRSCGGAIRRTKLRYCTECHNTESTRRWGNKCTKCGNKYIIGRGYMCKNCRTIYDVVEIK